MVLHLAIRTVTHSENGEIWYEETGGRVEVKDKKRGMRRRREGGTPGCRRGRGLSLLYNLENNFIAKAGRRSAEASGDIWTSGILEKASSSRPNRPLFNLPAIKTFTLFLFVLNHKNRHLSANFTLRQPMRHLDISYSKRWIRNLKEVVISSD